MPNPSHLLLASALALSFGPTVAAVTRPTLTQCSAITKSDDRLTCYDTLAANSAASEQTLARSAPTEPAEEPSSLSHHWELDRSDKRGTLSLRPHQKNYLLIANHSSAPNSEPFSQYRDLAPVGERAELMQTEIKYQLSLKTKVLEDLTPLHADVWAAYSQQSLWQAYNGRASSPFRDTNYQPELMAVVPLNIPLPGGVRARFVNFGIVHQSNGQALALSRSWDRVYAQVGLEKGNFNVLARVWQRRNESFDDDDNPDIIDYMGHGDLIATYHRSGHDFSLGLRRNFATNRGAVQADWAFPLTPHLKGYVQAFSGYGSSLIDYNHRQNTIGAGVLLDY
jgi:phospholipase A1